MSRLAGLVASINHSRLESCLASILMNGGGNFPIFCLCQDFSLSEQQSISSKYQSKNIHFDFIERIEPIGNLIKVRNKQLLLTPGFDLYYLFDDDFMFQQKALDDILNAAITIDKDKHIGAIMLNRMNDYPLHRKPGGFKKCKILEFNNFYQGSFPRLISAYWTNGGIIFKKEAFQSFEDEDTYFFGDDIGIYVSIYLRGYKILAMEANVLHFAGLQQDAYVHLLHAAYKLSHDNNERGTYWRLKHLNYLNKFQESGFVRVFHLFGVSAMTPKGVWLHYKNNNKNNHTNKINKPQLKLKDAISVFFYTVKWGIMLLFAYLVVSANIKNIRD